MLSRTQRQIDLVRTVSGNHDFGLCSWDPDPEVVWQNQVLTTRKGRLFRSTSLAGQVNLQEAHH